jgi:hypothetical protein
VHNGLIIVKKMGRKEKSQVRRAWLSSEGENVAFETVMGSV